MLKEERFRSEQYLSFVRSLPCCICKTDQEIVAHHIKGVGYLSGGKLKAEDTMTMPLCVRCHSLMHENPELWLDQWEYTAQTLAKFVKLMKISTGL